MENEERKDLFFDPQPQERSFLEKLKNYACTCASECTRGICAFTLCWLPKAVCCDLPRTIYEKAAIA